MTVTAAALALVSGPAGAASQFQDTAGLDRLVSETIGAEIGEPGGARTAVDNRLRLATCPAEPRVEGPVFGAAIVRCPELGWRIRVPLNMDAQGKSRAAQPEKAEILIRRGQNVILVYRGAGFSLSKQMIADENGAIGDLIAVRQDRRSPRILAEVTGNGQVILPTP
ncbi:flagella basal body P-ring formation protein FlgA [Parasphingorhabdus marina]|nr:flagella basal body P-ring formation protein FlgA [Parasphingorhabdus marina]